MFWLSFVWLAAYSEGLTETDAVIDADDERDPFLVSLGAQLFCCLLFPFVGLIADQTGSSTVTTAGTVLTVRATSTSFWTISRAFLGSIPPPRAVSPTCRVLPPPRAVSPTRRVL